MIGKAENDSRLSDYFKINARDSDLHLVRNSSL